MGWEVSWLAEADLKGSCNVERRRKTVKNWEKQRNTETDKQWKQGDRGKKNSENKRNTMNAGEGGTGNIRNREIDKQWTVQLEEDSYVCGKIMKYYWISENIRKLILQTKTKLFIKCAMRKAIFFLVSWISFFNKRRIISEITTSTLSENNFVRKQGTRALGLKTIIWR